MSNRNPQLDTGLVQAMETYFKGKQLKNETKQVDTNSMLAAANAGLAAAKRVRELQQAALFDRTLHIQVDKAKADLEYTQQAMRESAQRINESEQRISKMASEANLIQEQIRYWDAHATNEAELMPDLIRARTWQAMQSGNLSEAQIDVANSVVRLNDKKIEQLVTLIDKLTIEAGEEAIEFELLNGMQKMGLNGIKPRDILSFFKAILLSYISK